MLKKFWVQSTFLLVSCLMLASCSNNDDDNTVASDPNTKVIGASTASYMTLPNGIRALVVSSPGYERPVISISVQAGNYHDPDHQPGLAHFVEHVLFGGNAENPNPTEYWNFISSKNGVHNAHTGTQYTTYFLQLKPEFFDEGVRRLSRFFVAPLFSESVVAGEKEIIHNEYSRRIVSDQIFRSSIGHYDIGSKVRRFFVGNRESLKSVTTVDAKNFFEQNYAPTKTTIVVYGPQSVAKLKDLVVKNFSDVPKRSEPKTIEPSKSSVARDSKIMKISNDKLPNQLDMTFKGGEGRFKRETHRLIGTILGDESAGSLLSVLQARGLALPTKAALTGGTRGNSAMVKVMLTPNGVERVEEVVSLVRGYLEFMKASPLPQHLVQKVVSSSKAEKLETSFDQLSMDHIVSLSEQLPYVDNWQDLFEVTEVGSPTEAEYREFLAQIDLTKFNGTLSENSKTVSLESIGLAKHAFQNNEKLEYKSVNGKVYLLDGWYNGAYEELRPPQSSVQALADPDFALPPENKYFPSAFTMLPLFSKKEITGLNSGVLLNSGAGEKLPKVTFTGAFIPTFIKKDDKVQVSRMILMKNWLLSNLRQSVYLFEEAGYETNLAIQPVSGAFVVTFNGWSDEFEKAAPDFLKLIYFSEDEVAFQKFKQLQVVSLQQQAKTADSAMSDAFNEYYLPNFPDRQEQLKAIESVTLNELKELYHRIFSEYYFQGVMSGNVKPEHAQAVIEAVAAKWPQTKVLSESQLVALKKPVYGKVQQPISVEISLDGMQNSYVSSFFQFGYQSAREQRIAYILARWVEQPFFDELRGQQQVSYGPMTQFQFKGEYYGINFIVDSGTHGAFDVSQRVQAFLIDWVTNDLPKKSADDLEAMKKFIQTGIEQSEKTFTHQDATNEYIYESTEYADKDQSLDFTLEELVEFARQKLVQSPEGVFVKVKSVNDAPAAVPAPVFHMGGK